MKMRKSKPHSQGPTRTCLESRHLCYWSDKWKIRHWHTEETHCKTHTWSVATPCQAGTCFCTNNHKAQPRRDFFHACLCVFDQREDSNHLLTFATSQADKIKANLQWEVTAYSSKYFPSVQKRSVLSISIRSWMTKPHSCRKAPAFKMFQNKMNIQRQDFNLSVFLKGSQILRTTVFSQS